MNNFLCFDHSRFFVKKLGIQSCKEWHHYTKSPGFNKFIPKAPDYYYAEWTNWYDFLGKSRDPRKYKVNDNYFKKWSHNMAYILGFWFADGCITKGRFFVIKQHVKDKYLLEKISSEMKSTYPIREENNTCSFEINSREIYNDILKLGGKERKSLDVKFPNIPKEYLPDFIRGLWDGDGTIGATIKIRKAIGFKASLSSGSKEFILGVEKKLKENIIDLKTVIYEHKTSMGTMMACGKPLARDSVVYYLSLSVNNSKKLRDFMYSNRKSELKLIRKYKRFVSAGEYRPAPGTINYMSFADAKKLMAEKKFRSIHDYRRWLKSQDCKVVLPCAPDIVYEGWKGWSDFLGHSRLSYRELSRLAKENKINGRRNYNRWIQSIRGNSWGKYPRHPDMVYSEWQGWGKFLQKA